MKITRIGLVANVRKKEICEVMSVVLDNVPRNVDIVGTPETAGLCAQGRVAAASSMSGCDAVLALGGDGTLLYAARLVEADEIPLLGIKIRSLGFLTEDDPVRAINDLFAGKFVIQDRMRLEVTTHDGAPRHQRYSALNDVVVHAVGVSRVVHIRTTIDNAMLGEYLADGVIVSTPTGSTAYSLAAGGPIVNPATVQVFIITPLCPHSLSVRPIVVSSDETFSVEIVEKGQEVLLTIDGQQSCPVQGGERIIFRRCSRVTKLVVTAGYSFYDVVRRKLRWGGVLRQH